MTGGNPLGYLQAWQMMFNSKLLRINPDIAVSVGLYELLLGPPDCNSSTAAKPGFLLLFFV